MLHAVDCAASLQVTATLPCVFSGRARALRPWVWRDHRCRTSSKRGRLEAQESQPGGSRRSATSGGSFADVF